MTKYTRKVTRNGVTQYRDVTNNKLVAEANLDQAVKEELDLAAEGEVVDTEGMTSDHSTQTDADGNEVNDKPATPVTEDNSEDVAGDGDGTDQAEDEESSDVDSPEMQGTFTPAEPKPVKRPKMDDGKQAARSPAGIRLPEPSEKGFGFPRRNGKTGDIFDFDTPHTQVKFVDGLIVPLSDKTLAEKSEFDIHNRLVELGYVDDEGTRLV